MILQSLWALSQISPANNSSFGALNWISRNRLCCFRSSTIFSDFYLCWEVKLLLLLKPLDRIRNEIHVVHQLPLQVHLQVCPQIQFPPEQRLGPEGGPAAGRHGPAQFWWSGCEWVVLLRSSALWGFWGEQTFRSRQIVALVITYHVAGSAVCLYEAAVGSYLLLLRLRVHQRTSTTSRTSSRTSRHTAKISEVSFCVTVMPTPEQQSQHYIPVLGDKKED